MSNKDKLLENAQKFLAKGQLGKAIGEYQKLVEALPKDFRNRQKLAELLSREKRNDEAQPHFEAVARNFTETGFYLKAIAIYKQMQKNEPGRVDIYLRLAELNEKQGLIGNALNEYRSLVSFYEKNQMVRESVGVLQKMVALDPENLGFRGKLIESQIAVAEPQEALDQFRTLVGILDGKGEPGKIIKLYEKFIDLCPEEVEHRLPLAEALLKAGQAEKSLAVLKNLLKQTPDHPGLLSVLTDCHLTLGNHDDARLTCQHLLKDNPQDLGLRERYLRICIAGADYERALDSLEDSKEAFFQSNRLELLRELYETLQQVLPGNPRLQATLAALYETTGAAVTAPVAGRETGPAPEETVDAGIVDVALDDVEHLDLVGEPVAPGTQVPPLGVPAPPAKEDKPKGLELELDLDLDLDLEPVGGPAAVSPSPPAVPEPPPPVQPPAAAPPVVAPAEPSAEMELELDLGGLDDLTPDLPAEDVAIAGAAAEATPAEVPAEVVAETELSLPDLGDIVFEVETTPEAGLSAEDIVSAPEPYGEPVVQAVPEVADALPVELGFELEAEVPFEPAPLEEVFTAFTEPETESRFEAVDLVVETSPTPLDELSFEELSVGFEDVAVEESARVETPPEDSAPVDADEVEVDEALEELEEVEELEVLDEVEDLADIEPCEDVEELDALDELEDIEELEAVEDETVDMTPEQVAFGSPAAQLRDEIEEAEFYLRQGLFDDAERVVVVLQSRYGELPELVAKLTEIGGRRQASAASGEEQESFFDLMADLKDEDVLGATDFLGEPGPGETDEFSLDSSGEGEEDLQSHFDLGIAYKEMGLLEDAIAEFGKASRDPSRQLDCLTLKGQCLLEMGDIKAAEGTFKEALAKPDLHQELRVALRYELGLLYEVADRPLEALENYQLVADQDLFFRDVTDKLKVLRQKLGIDDQAIESLQDEGSKRDRISYV